MGADTMAHLLGAALYLLKSCVSVAFLVLLLTAVTWLIATVAKAAWKD